MLCQPIGTNLPLPWQLYAKIEAQLCQQDGKVVPFI